MSVFFQPHIKTGASFLNEEESKHCTQVLRHTSGDDVTIFDGQGTTYLVRLTTVSKKKCDFEIISKQTFEPTFSKIHLAIAPTKNMDRMEWLVEKLTEIGIDKISLIQTQNSERRKIRLDRLEKKAISAMKQSKNPFLPHIHLASSIKELLETANEDVRLIAHVDKSHRYITQALRKKQSTIILIGPEGDFTKEEVQSAKAKGFVPISLGPNTLRTETAGLVACCIIHSYHFS